MDNKSDMIGEIIKVNDYLLIVDSSQISEGDLCLANAKTYNNEIVTYRSAPCPSPYVSNLDILRKIIAHLPLNGSSILGGVDLLPPIEDDVEVLANELYPIEMEDGWDKNKQYRDEFILGYSAAKERFKYTEEDIMKAIKMAQEESWDEGGYLGLEHEPNKIIQFLQKPKYPVGFEFETKDVVKDVLVGTYKW
jgi:hypothetical protein